MKDCVLTSLFSLYQHRIERTLAWLEPLNITDILNLLLQYMNWLTVSGPIRCFLCHIQI